MSVGVRYDLSQRLSSHRPQPALWFCDYGHRDQSSARPRDKERAPPLCHYDCLEIAKERRRIVPTNPGSATERYCARAVRTNDSVTQELTVWSGNIAIAGLGVGTVTNST